MVRTFRARVGPGRITKTLRPSQAGYTRQVRSQMDSIEKTFSDFIDSLIGITPQAVENALRPTFELSQKYVPVDTSALKNSGFLEVRESGSRVVAELGYGKGNKPFYAPIVHERTDIQHSAPTRAKFLQSAIEEDSANIPARLLEEYKKETRL